MTNKIKEKQLKEVLYGLDYIGNKIKNDDGKLELGVNNCKLLLNYITNLQQQIDKAIKYIDNCFAGEEVPRGDDYWFNEYYYYEPLEKEEAMELLDILKGEE